MKKFAPQFVITNKIAKALTQIERARGFLEAATLSEDWIARMSRRALLLEAHFTTHIEGTQLSLAQAEQLWEGQEVPSADPDDRRWQRANLPSTFDAMPLPQRLRFQTPFHDQ